MTHPSSHPRRLRTIVATVGAAAVLVGGTGALAEAASHAKPVLLGKKNKATKTTTIQNKKAKPALALKSKSGPALSVNTNALVANLNADLLDGKSLEQVSPTRYTATVYTAGGTTTSGIIGVSSTTIPAGSYQASVTGLFSLGAGQSVACEAIDYTRLQASPSDLTAVLLASVADGDSGRPDLGDSRIVSIVAGHQYIFVCSAPAGVTVAQPGVFTLQSVDPVAAIPGQSPFTLKPSGPQIPSLN